MKPIKPIKSKKPLKSIKIKEIEDKDDFVYSSLSLITNETTHSTQPSNPIDNSVDRDGSGEIESSKRCIAQKFSNESIIPKIAYKTDKIIKFLSEIKSLANFLTKSNISNIQHDKNNATIDSIVSIKSTASESTLVAYKPSFLGDSRKKSDFDLFAYQETDDTKDLDYQEFIGYKLNNNEDISVKSESQSIDYITYKKDEDTFNSLKKQIKKTNKPQDLLKEKILVCDNISKGNEFNENSTSFSNQVGFKDSKMFMIVNNININILTNQMQSLPISTTQSLKTSSNNSKYQNSTFPTYQTFASMTPHLISNNQHKNISSCNNKYNTLNNNSTNEVISTKNKNQNHNSTSIAEPFQPNFLSQIQLIQEDINHLTNLIQSQPLDEIFNTQFNSNNRKYQMFSNSFKALCIRECQRLSPKKVAEKRSIPLKSLKRWIEVGADRKKGGGRKVKDPEMESRLIDWYLEEYGVLPIAVGAKALREKALEFSTISEFQASKGWLEKFKKKLITVVENKAKIKVEVKAEVKREVYNNEIENCLVETVNAVDNILDINYTALHKVEVEVTKDLNKTNSNTISTFKHQKSLTHQIPLRTLTANSFPNLTGKKRKRT